MKVRAPEYSVTKASGTTQYTAGDVVGGLFTFPIGGASGLIRSVLLIDSAAESTKPDVDLFLFTAAPTVAADNDAFAPTDAQMLNCVGVVALAGSGFKVAGANGAILASGLSIGYTGRTLYGVLVARNAYSPITLEVFTVRLGIEST